MAGDVYGAKTTFRESELMTSTLSPESAEVVTTVEYSQGMGIDHSR
jgi:hypothetical protein